MPSPLAGGVIAILRARHGEHLDLVIDTLAESGVPCLEITLNTPGALPALRRAALRVGDVMTLGAGTVRSPSDVDAAAAAGARFVVSPHTEPAVAARAIDQGLDYLPGAFTASEVAQAWALRPCGVKLFPARLGGPKYLRELREPLDDVAFVPTGGVSVDELPQWFEAGAVAVGMGGPLVGDALDTGDVAGLRERASAVLAAVQARREREAYP